MLPPPAGASAHTHRAEELEETDSEADAPMLTFETYDLDVMDIDEGTHAALAQDHVPQTMTQMAEAAEAAREGRRDGDEGGEANEEVIASAAPPRAGSAARTGAGEKLAVTLRSASKLRAPPRGTARGTAVGRRKRARRTGNEDSSEDGSGEDGGGAQRPSPSPSKRARTRAPPAPPPPTRTLRPRAAKAKTAARLAEEQEIEEAFEEAVAE